MGNKKNSKNLRRKHAPQRKNPGYPRYILGYKCMIRFDLEDECYIIRCDKFPGMYDDGPTRGTATRRYKERIRKAIAQMEKDGIPVPGPDRSPEEPERWREVYKDGHKAGQMPELRGGDIRAS